MLNQLQLVKASNSFAIFDTRAYARRMASVDLPSTTHVYLGDVKNMYTNIDHKKLCEVIDWVIYRIDAVFPHDTVFVPQAKTKSPTWAQYKDPKSMGTVLTMSQMREILLFDIKNLYFALGDKILRQTLGVPMGSPSSPALAVALCMHAEHCFMQANPNVKVIAGFRYIDDLLLYLNAPCDAISTMYPPPLELEEEDTKVGKGHQFRFLEAWTELTQTPNSQKLRVSVTHCLRTWLRAKEQKAPLKNITPFDTHVPHHQLFGYTVGALHRAWENSIGTENKTIAALRTLEAFRSFGMQNVTAKQAIMRMHRKTRNDVWLEAVAPLYFL